MLLERYRKWPRKSSVIASAGKNEVWQVSRTCQTRQDGYFVGAGVAGVAVAALFALFLLALLFLL